MASAELHHYSAASQKSYGAVSYLRLKNAGGDVHCCFLLAKSKLAPIKSVSIPRLELMAAVVAVRLDATFRKELRLCVSNRNSPAMVRVKAASKVPHSFC